MSLRVNGAAGRIRTHAGFWPQPNEQLATICGFFWVNSTQTNTIPQPLILQGNASYGDDHMVMWRSGTSGDQMVVSNVTSSVVTEVAFASQPLTQEWFFLYMRCQGSGLEAGFRLLNANSFVTASVASHAGFTENEVEFSNVGATYYSDARVAHVRIWDAYLSDAELMLESFSSLPVRIANLNLAWMFTSTTTGPDLGPNGRYAILDTIAGVEEDPPIYDLLHDGRSMDNFVAAGNWPHRHKTYGWARF